MLYRLFRAAARVALHLFFRRIEVEGTEHIPATGPVLFVPNHTNALVDPLVLMVSTHRRVTLTAKHVLARNPLLGLFMRALGVVPFRRRQDVALAAELRRNERSLERCRKILAGGGAICIFPEGVSHSDPKLRPFRTGPARIALDFVRQDGNIGSLTIVPVGLLYMEKNRFRSGVWLRFGAGLDVGVWLAEHPHADAKLLTEEIRRRVEALTLNYERRRESAILGWAAEIVATGGKAPPPLGGREPSTAEWFHLVSRLQAGYRALLERRRDEVDALSARIRAYRRELRRRGIDASEVYLPMHAGRALLFVVREAELLMVGLPLTIFGILSHIVPAFIVRWIARAMSRDKDQWASNTVYPGLVVFALFYALQLSLAWRLLPTPWAALYTVALPYTGYYTLLYRDRAGGVVARVRAFVSFLFDRDRQERLAREGRKIIARVVELDAWLQRTI
jgi:glycerol-3-phosphate O-acyltransferase/dihydroxyacetone phosphate acyltransferase